MKIKIKRTVKISTLILIFFNIFIWNMLLDSTSSYMADVMGLSNTRGVVQAKDSKETLQPASHTLVSDKRTPLSEEDSMEQWVLREADNRGLNRNEVWSIIQAESSWRPDAINVNTNGSYDLGLWQWNSIHKDISTACKLDFRCSTNEAFNKRIHDGNWCAWYGSHKLGIGNCN